MKRLPPRSTLFPYTTLFGSKGGEIFVLDMGEPVSIMQLARDMIELSGLKPDQDIAIDVVGRRPGEKLHEELFNPYERSEEHTSELQSRQYLVCRLLLEKKKS